MIFGLVVMDDSVVFQYWTFSDHHALQRSDLHCQERRDVHHRGADLPISGRSSSGSLRSQWITIHGELNCFNCVFDQSVFRALWITICLAVSLFGVLKSCSYQFQRALNHDMPQRDFFSCLRESDAEFISRTGWYYTHNSPVNMPPDVIVLPPV